MNKDIFYRYDFYTLERIYPELKFIEFINESSSLNLSTDNFIVNVVESLYVSINDSIDVKSTEIEYPNIDEKLEIALSNNPLYTSYKEYSNESLSEFVFNKFLKRIFEMDGHNNETHIIQNYIHSWLEKKLVLKIVQDERFNSLVILKSLLNKTQMLHGLYTDLIENIPKEWVLSQQTAWTDVDVNNSKLIDSIGLYQKNFLDDYESSILKLSKENVWDFVQEATRSSDYMMLSSEFRFVSAVLIRNDVSLWIKFWDNLKLPIIQDCVFFSIFSFKPQQFLELVSNLVDEKLIVKSNLKVLLFIVAQNCFETSNKLTEQFSIYGDIERKNEQNKDFFEEGIEQQNVWLGEREGYYEKIIKFLQEKISRPELENWIFSYKPRTNIHQSKSNEIYNSELMLLVETYKKILPELPNIELHSINLQKFNFYVDITREKNDKVFSLHLLEVITDFISSDKFYWDRTFDEPYLSSLKNLGYIICQQEDPIQKANEIINKFKITHQGWNPSKIDFSLLTKESFIYSGVALMFENEDAFKNTHEKTSFFKVILKHILVQNRYSHINNSEYYQIPLHLLFLVSSQIFLDVKEYYEHELIDKHDDLYSLLLIFHNDEHTICESSKLLMNERLEKEFLLLKRKFTNRSQIDKAQELEMMIEKLKLEERNIL